MGAGVNDRFTKFAAAVIMGCLLTIIVAGTVELVSLILW
jgi:hypothetical protein